jgi:hypothetical protein
MVSIVLMLMGVVLGAWLLRKPDHVAVETSLHSYVEGMAMSGKIVLVEARDKVVISKTTPGFLFGDTTIGRFLGIRSDATIQASAWADIAYVIDLYTTESWSVRYNPMNGGTLAMAAPPISMLTPAIHTDTIEITTIDRSIFLDERQLEKEALASLTSHFVEAASAMLKEPVLQDKASAALESLVRAFLAREKIPVSSVDISFATAKD